MASHTEKDGFRDVAKVEAHTPPVAAAVLSDFVPNDHGLVGEAPLLEDAEPLRNQGIRYPKVAMRTGRHMLDDR